MITARQSVALRRWLDANVGPGEGLGLEPIPGGQSNPTYYLTAGGRSMVLRKQPAGSLLKGAHAIDREYRVQSALAGSGVPVPRMVAYCEDAGILGTPFYLMERLEGRVWHETSMPGVAPAERRAMYLSVARTMARMHSLKPEAIGLGDFGRPGNYFARQVSRWGRQWQQAQSRGIPELDRLRDWLAARIPSDDGMASITHGDFRIGNIMFAPDRPEVVAVLDWELSTLGHPMADLGFFCMCWRTQSHEYGGLHGTGWRKLGVPDKAEFLREYESHLAHETRLTPFHEAFALFRFAVIFVGIADRALMGNAAANAAVEEAKKLARAFARHGLNVAAETN